MRPVTKIGIQTQRPTQNLDIRARAHSGQSLENETIDGTGI